MEPVRLGKFKYVIIESVNIYSLTMMKTSSRLFVAHNYPPDELGSRHRYEDVTDWLIQVVRIVKMETKEHFYYMPFLSCWFCVYRNNEAARSRFDVCSYLSNY